MSFSDIIDGLNFLLSFASVIFGLGFIIGKNAKK